MISRKPRMNNCQRELLALVSLRLMPTDELAAITGRSGNAVACSMIKLKHYGLVASTKRRGGFSVSWATPEIVAKLESERDAEIAERNRLAGERKRLADERKRLAESWSDSPMHQVTVSSWRMERTSAVRSVFELAGAAP